MTLLATDLHDVGKAGCLAIIAEGDCPFEWCRIGLFGRHVVEDESAWAAWRMPGMGEVVRCQQGVHSSQDAAGVLHQSPGLMVPLDRRGIQGMQHRVLDMNLPDGPVRKAGAAYQEESAASDGKAPYQAGGDPLQSEISRTPAKTSPPGCGGPAFQGPAPQRFRSLLSSWPANSCKSCSDGAWSSVVGASGRLRREWQRWIRPM